MKKDIETKKATTFTLTCESVKIGSWAQWAMART